MRDLLVVALLSTPALASDLDDAVDAMKKSGMSERAEDALDTTAQLLAGSAVYSCKPEKNGGVSSSYASGGACLRPGLTPQQRKEAQDRLDARANAWAPFLKTHADSNGDGFVSTNEARTLQHRVELGFCVEGLPEKDVDGIAKRLRRKPEDVRADLATLRTLREDAQKQKLDGVPDVKL
jgi:hypothetical protein